jgi:hypothetical protein
MLVLMTLEPKASSLQRNLDVDGGPQGAHKTLLEHVSTSVQDVRIRGMDGATNIRHSIVSTVGLSLTQFKVQVAETTLGKFGMMKS